MGFDITSYLMGKAAGGGGGGGGGSTPIFEWDFTGSDPLVDKRKGLTITNRNTTLSSAGAEFDSAQDRLEVGAFIPGLTFEIDFGEMILTSGQNNRCIIGASGQGGLVYRSTGVWGFYDINNYAWATDSEESSASFLSNSTLKIVVGIDRYWHFYKNGVLWYEPDKTNNVNGFQIGSSGGNSMYPAVVKALRIY